MPKAMEKKLRAEAEKKGLSGKRKNAYIYGTMRKTGWRPKKIRLKTLSQLDIHLECQYTTPLNGDRQLLFSLSPSKSYPL